MPPSPAQASLRETLVGAAILTALAGILAAVFLSQFRFNPAVLTPDRLGAAPTSFQGRTEETGLVSPPEGFLPMSPPETFGPETLSDKIDGKADLYLSAGFRSLRTQRFRRETAPGEWMEVFVYEMDDARNAFSVLSAQRREDALPLEAGENGYRTENAFFFTSGNRYVEIVAAVPGEASLRAMADIAASFSETAGAIPSALPEKDLFPGEGLDPESIALIPDDAFGCEDLDQVFTATYGEGPDRVSAFLSRRASPEEASALARTYAEFLLRFGGEALPLPEGGVPGARVVRILDTVEVVFSTGPYLAGVREAPDPPTALRLAETLSRSLEKSP